MITVRWSRRTLMALIPLRTGWVRMSCFFLRAMVVYFECDTHNSVPKKLLPIRPHEADK